MTKKELHGRCRLITGRSDTSLTLGFERVGLARIYAFHGHDQARRPSFSYSSYVGTPSGQYLSFDPVSGNIQRLVPYSSVFRDNFQR